MHTSTTSHADTSTLRKMQAYGGSFASALATAWLLADPHNSEVLQASFGAMLDRYALAPEVQP